MQHGLLANDPIERDHEGPEPVFTHGGDAVVPVEPLLIMGLRALRHPRRRERDDRDPVGVMWGL